MVRLQINGENHKLDKIATINQLLAHFEIDPRHCAVEYNREIIAKSRYGMQIIADGDHIEIVNFVGGG